MKDCLTCEKKNRIFALQFEKVKKSYTIMLIIDVKNGESIDQALKRYKRKFRNAKVMKELRNRKQFTKPSVKRRNEILKAVYKEEKSIIII